MLLRTLHRRNRLNINKLRKGVRGLQPRTSRNGRVRPQKIFFHKIHKVGLWGVVGIALRGRVAKVCDCSRNDVILSVRS